MWLPSIDLGWLADLVHRTAPPIASNFYQNIFADYLRPFCGRPLKCRLILLINLIKYNDYKILTTWGR